MVALLLQWILDIYLAEIFSLGSDNYLHCLYT